jgi:hypothetical protein
MLVVNKVSSPMVGPFDASAVRDIFVRLEKEAVEQLRRAGAVTNGTGDLSLLRSVDMKYKGQVHDVSVPVPSGEYSAASAVAMADRFHERYESRYGKGTTNKNAPIEAMSFEVRVAAKGRALRLAKERLETGAPSPTRGKRPVYFRETKGFTETPIFDREALAPGQEIAAQPSSRRRTRRCSCGPRSPSEWTEYRNLLLSVLIIARENPLQPPKAVRCGWPDCLARLTIAATEAVSRVERRPLAARDGGGSPTMRMDRRSLLRGAAALAVASCTATPATSSPTPAAERRSHGEAARPVQVALRVLGLRRRDAADRDRARALATTRTRASTSAGTSRPTRRASGSSAPGSTRPEA